MKTIQVSDEMYNSLMEISKELNTQDHRATAMPYFFQIRTDKWNYVQEGNGEEVWVQDGFALETEEDIKNAVIEYKEWEDLPQAEVNKMYKELEDYEIEEILENNYRLVYREKAHEFKNAFFTEKACKRHIEANDYHYNNPTDYLQYAGRNPEMETIMKFLCELSGGELHL